MRKFVLTLIFASVLFCLPTQAEEFLLKDGTKITGTLTGVSGDNLQIKTAYGDISVPRAQIISITFTENQPKAAEPAASSGAVRPMMKSLHDGKYVNQSGGFAVTLPADWKLAPSLLDSIPSLIAALSSGDETRLFAVTPEKFGGTTDTLSSAGRDADQDQLYGLSGAGAERRNHGRPEGSAHGFRRIQQRFRNAAQVLDFYCSV